MKPKGDNIETCESYTDPHIVAFKPDRFVTTTISILFRISGQSAL